MSGESVLYAPSISAALYILGEAITNLTAGRSRSNRENESEVAAYISEIDTLNLSLMRCLKESGEPSARDEILESARDLIGRLGESGWV